MKFINKILQKVVRSRSRVVVGRIDSYLKPTDKIIDIGSGSGDVAFLLKNKGVDITPVDVDDFHGPRLIKTIIYDGKRLPYPDKSFDKALLLMVLHHTPDPELVFSEAARVAKEIVLIETSYTSQLSKFFTVITDAMGNLRLEAFWKSYKSDEEWRKLIKKMGFTVADSHQFNDKNMGLPFLHISYYLKRA